MKTRLKPEDRALFDAAREGFAPTDDDRARVAKALGLNLGVGAGISSAAAKAAAGSAAASPTIAGLLSGVVAAKWVAVVAVVVCVGAGGVALHRADTAPARVPPAGAESAREPPSLRAPDTARTQVVGEAQPSPPSSLSLSIESTKPASVPAPRRPSSFSVTPGAGALARGSRETLSEPGRAPTTSPLEPPPPEGTAAVATSVRVAEEARLLSDADAALRAGDTANATRLLDDHARLFPQGVLAEERDVQRVLVLCAAHQVDAAHVAASRFLSTYPQSLLAGRVRTSCGAP